jgi:uncharacterized protein with von Willebrand factor type A (vWA) domain
MEIKDTKLVLKVKSFKAGKYITLLLNDSLEDFQKSVAPLVPRIISSLRRNHGHQVKENLEKYIDHLETMTDLAKQVLKLTESSIIPNMEFEEGESGRSVTVDGNINYSVEKGHSVNVATGKGKKNKEE